MTELTTSNVKDALKGKVFVKAHADWCGPCKMVAPMISELESENGDWNFYSLDVDKEPAIFSQFNSKGVPTCAIIYDGQVLEVLVGVQPKAEYQKKLDLYSAEIDKVK